MYISIKNPWQIVLFIMYPWQHMYIRVLKIPWGYTKINLFALYGGLNRCGIQTYVTTHRHTVELHRMNFMCIIATEYHVVYVCGLLCGIHGITHRCNTWRYPWYQSWMQRVMRSTYSLDEPYYVPTMMFGMCCICNDCTHRR